MGTGTVAVLGATGKTGRAVAAAALRSGLDVRATSRWVDPPGGTGRIAGEGDTVVAGCRSDDTCLPRSGRACDHPGRLTWHRADLLTGDGLAQALTGTDAAYLIVPNVHPGEVEMVGRAAQLARAAGVGRVAYHSVLDPDDARMAHHVRKGQAERALLQTYPDATILRPCAYQQNLSRAALTGALRVPYGTDQPFSLVDLEDVAEVAAAALGGDQRLTGATVELCGPEDLSVEELARQAATALGRPVVAEELPVDRWLAGPGAELDAQQRAELVAMFRAYDQTGFTGDPAPLTHLLGRAPTTWTQLLSKETP